MCVQTYGHLCLTNGRIQSSEQCRAEWKSYEIFVEQAEDICVLVTLYWRLINFRRYRFWKGLCERDLPNWNSKDEILFQKTNDRSGGADVTEVEAMTSAHIQCRQD